MRSMPFRLLIYVSVRTVTQKTLCIQKLDKILPVDRLRVNLETY